MVGKYAACRVRGVPDVFAGRCDQKRKTKKREKSNRLEDSIASPQDLRPKPPRTFMQSSKLRTEGVSCLGEVWPIDIQLRLSIFADVLFWQVLMEKPFRRILDLGVVGLELRVTGIMPKSSLLGKSPKLMIRSFSQPLIGEEAQDLGVVQSGTEFPKLAVVVHSLGV